MVHLIDQEEPWESSSWRLRMYNLSHYSILQRVLLSVSFSKFALTFPLTLCPSSPASAPACRGGWRRAAQPPNTEAMTIKILSTLAILPTCYSIFTLFNSPPISSLSLINLVVEALVLFSRLLFFLSIFLFLVSIIGDIYLFSAMKDSLIVNVNSNYD